MQFYKRLPSKTPADFLWSHNNLTGNLAKFHHSSLDIYNSRYVFVTHRAKQFQKFFTVDILPYLAEWNINTALRKHCVEKYEGWNFNSGNYLFTTDTK